MRVTFIASKAVFWSPEVLSVSYPLSEEIYETQHPRNVALVGFCAFFQVTGYVLVHECDLNTLPLDGLRLIRGSQLYLGAALHIGQSSFTRLGLGLLTEISQGNVTIEAVPQLCFVQSINWTDIFNDKTQQSQIAPNTASCKDFTGKISFVGCLCFAPP